MKSEILKRDFSEILHRWKAALDEGNGDLDLARDSAILRFELTYEVAWKLLQVLLRDEGYEVRSPKQAFQEAFTLGWITDEEIWAEIIDARSMAVHVYREQYAKQLFQKLSRYYTAFQALHTAIVPSE